MKKALYLVLLSCLLPLCGFTQNWQCLQTGVTRYYAGEYLRGMRIDSVKTAGDTIIQYPFHSPRGGYYYNPVLDTNGGSWLGKEVTILPDGTTLFDNLWGDTCIIRTQATLGDSWMFYDDTTTRYYTATVVSLDTMTILGITDSIKDIQLQAYANNILNPADSLHNRHIILSKEHGFQSTLSIYSFPYHSASNTSGFNIFEDYLMDRIEYNVFSQQPYIYQLIDSPTFKKTALYDFQPGVVFATKQEYSYGSSSYINWSMDSIISRTDINADTILYTILTTTRHQNNIYPYSSTTTVSVHTTTVYNIPFSILTNLYGLPDESPVKSFITYRPNDSSHCYKSLLYGIGPSYISGNILNNFEPCGQENLYKNGFGHIYNSTCYDPTPGNYDLLNMIYSKKNGIACGYPPVLGVEEVSAADAISIYPIPADRELHLSVPQ